MSRWLFLLFLLFVYGCKKPDLPATRVFLQLTNPNTGEPVTFETVSASWDFDSGKLYMYAESYYHEVFRMSIENISDTGMFTGLSPASIFYSDGQEFNSVSIESGVIHISTISPGKISGYFKARLLSNSSSYPTDGNFQIINSN